MTGIRKLLPLVLLLTLAAAAQTVQQVRIATSDNVQLDGIVYRAAQPRPAALLLVHGFSSNFYEGYFPALAQEAAAQGYTTLALNMRDHDSGPKISDFADNEKDIAAAAAYLRANGAKRVLLLGQSMGTNRVLYYQAATRDPNIAGTVLVSGPGNLFQWNVWQFGREKAQASVDEALKLESSGHEKELMAVNLGPLGKALYTPRYLLSMRGPNARSDPYQNLAKVSNPILILQGKADKLIEPDIAERLKRAAPAGSKVDVIYMEGAGHQFRSSEAELSHRILNWLKAVAP